MLARQRPRRVTSTDPATRTRSAILRNRKPCPVAPLREILGDRSIGGLAGCGTMGSSPCALRARPGNPATFHLDHDGPGPTACDRSHVRPRVRPTQRTEPTPLMVDRNLLRELDVAEVDADEEQFDMGELLGDSRGVEAGGIVPGRVIEIVGDQVVVDVGYKSEGLVPLNEWEDGEAPPQPGRRDRGPAGGDGRRHRRGRPLPQEGRPDAGAGSASSPSIAKGTSSPARSPARSRAACSSTSASTPSCRPARSTSAARRTSPTTSTARSAA